MNLDVSIIVAVGSVIFIEDTAGNSLAVFSNKAVTNNSTQQAPEEPEPAEDEIHHSGISIFGRSVQ